MAPISTTYQDFLRFLPAFEPEEIEGRGVYDVKIGKITVDTSKRRIVDQNPRRVMMIVVNEGSFLVRVDFDGNVTTDDGWPIFPNGGVLSLSIFGDIVIVRKPLYAVAQGTTRLTFVEVVKQT